MSTDLQFAAHVGQLVPVFVAPPGGSEFRRPPGWQHLDRDGNDVRLKEWRDRYAVCAVTGGPLAVVDVDPRNGGDVEKVQQLLAGLNVQVFAEIATPGGGSHFYVHGHPDLPTCHDLTGYPGVDVQSHGANVFLPGTRRPKYGGGGYTVHLDNLAALADGGDPDGAEALADWVSTHRVAGVQEPIEPSPPWNGEPPDARQAAYLVAALDGQHAELSRAAPGTRNPHLYKAALKCGSFVAGAGMDQGDVIRTLYDAATINGLVAEDGAAKVHATIRSGLDDGKANPRAVPEPPPVTVVQPVVAPGNSRSDDAEALPPPSDPMAVARAVLGDFTVDGQLTTRRWRGGWMRWEQTHWSEVEATVVEKSLYARLEHAVYYKGTKAKPWEPNRHKVADLLAALTAITHLPENVNPPVWLTRDDTRSGDATIALPANEIVACTNGLLHVGTRQVLGLTPHYFNRVAVPFDYDPAAPAPARWLRFLAGLWPDDPASIHVLQEFFGYVLSGRTDLHKIFLLIGPPRSGKGTIARVLTALIGKGNAAGPTLASLGTNFGLSPLLGRPLAVVSDARLSGTANVGVVVERLLSISGEDMLTVDRKYREPWTGQLPARFLVLSNELPRFGDASGAIASRFVVASLFESWLGKENPRLTAELLEELPGILTWALDGLDRLTGQGVFTEPESSRDAILALQDLVSPVAAFVRDRCDVEVGKEVLIADLYGHWRSWCDGNGHKPTTAQVFGRDLRAVVPHLRIRQPRDYEGKRDRWYVGIALKIGAER